MYSHDPISTGMRDALHLDSDGSDHSQNQMDSKGKGRVDTESLFPVKSSTVPSGIRGASKALKSVVTKQNNRKGKTKTISSSSEGEYFNFDDIVSSSDDRQQCCNPCQKKARSATKKLGPVSSQAIKSPSTTEKGLSHYDRAILKPYPIWKLG